MPSIRRDELAAVLGVDTDYYADLERGLLETPIPAELEDRIARALHLEGEYRQTLATRLRDVYEVSQDDPAASAHAPGRHRAPTEPDSALPGSAPEHDAAAPSASMAATAIPEQPAQATQDIGYGMVPVTSQSPAISEGASAEASAQVEAPFSFSPSPRTQPTGPQAAGGRLPGNGTAPSAQTGSVPEQPAPISSFSRIGSPSGPSPASAQTGSWSEPLTAPLSASQPETASGISDPLSAPLTAPLAARPADPLSSEPLSAPLSAPSAAPLSVPSAAPLSASSAAPLSAPSAAPLSAPSAPTEQWSSPLDSSEPQGPAQAASPAAASNSLSWQALPPASGQHTGPQPQVPLRERPATPEVWEHSDRWPGLRPSATAASDRGRPARMPGMQAPDAQAGPGRPSPAPTSPAGPTPALHSGSPSLPAAATQSPAAQIPAAPPRLGTTPSTEPSTEPTVRFAQPGQSAQSGQSVPSAGSAQAAYSAQSAQSAQMERIPAQGTAPHELSTAFAHAREPGMTGPQPRVPQSPWGSAIPAARPVASADAPAGHRAVPDQTGPQGIHRIQALPDSAQAQQTPSPQALRGPGPQSPSAVPGPQMPLEPAASPGGPTSPAPTAQRSAVPDQREMETPHQPRAQSPRPALAQFLETFDMPALLRSRTLGILAANRSGSQLYAPVLQWGGGHGQNVNLLEFALVAGEAAHRFWPDWQLVVSGALSELSLMAEEHPDDAEVISTVGALMTSSRDFGRMWSETTPHRLANEGTETIDHPLLGVVELPYRILYMDDDGSHVVVYAPVPGSSAHTAIKRLTE